MSLSRGPAIRRTPSQARADARAVDLARTLGRALRNGRKERRLSQAQIAEAAGLAQTTISGLERGDGAATSLLTWTRAVRAVGSDIRAYLEQVSAADRPRDSVHLRTQELILRTAATGGWKPIVEAALDADGTRSRAADVLLRRPGEAALIEVWDWFEDVGAALRSWDRRLARLDARAVASMRFADEQAPRVGGCWVVRATRRNRALVADHRVLFVTRFPGSGVGWLGALSDRQRPMPGEPALLWITVSGAALRPARLRA